jgi:hypothetical protein
MHGFLNMDIKPYIKKIKVGRCEYFELELRSKNYKVIHPLQEHKHVKYRS